MKIFGDINFIIEALNNSKFKCDVQIHKRDFEGILEKWFNITEWENKNKVKIKIYGK